MYQDYQTDKIGINQQKWHRNEPQLTRNLPLPKQLQFFLFLESS
ncbi:hypothetical protein C8C84_1359 [Flavobacterium sp. 102]|jgi:hypothetical protein|nr:hypothetical protein C8C84_1359 [Flavobacterium sp. 102]